jgi:hypothetical protein
LRVEVDTSGAVQALMELAEAAELAAEFVQACPVDARIRIESETGLIVLVIEVGCRAGYG